jgi:hypothetical protein
MSNRVSTSSCLYCVLRKTVTESWRVCVDIDIITKFTRFQERLAGGGAASATCLSLSVRRTHSVQAGRGARTETAMVVTDRRAERTRGLQVTAARKARAERAKDIVRLVAGRSSIYCSRSGWRKFVMSCVMPTYRIECMYTA